MKYLSGNIKRWIDFLIGVPLIYFFGLFVNTYRKTTKNCLRKILIIKLAAAGDTALLIPVLRSIKKTRPDISIHWLISPINVSIAKTVPYVDRVVMLPKNFLLVPWRLIGQIRRERYDAVVDMEQWARSTAILSFLSAVSLRAGFDTPGQHRAGLFTHTYIKTCASHEIIEFYNLASQLFPLAIDTSLELWETEQGEEEIKKYVPALFFEKPSVPVVILHPGCGQDGLPREWPLKRYAVVANWLKERYNAKIILTSGPEETEKTRYLRQFIDGQALDAGGKFSWEGMISLIKRSNLIISGNTGIMHFAAALKKPQVALHGPTNPDIWGPLNPHAKVIRSRCAKCPCLRLGFEYHAFDQSCMEKIDVEEVKNAVSSLLVS